MAERVIVRGDSYSLRRPLYRIELLDTDGLPFDLSGCTVRTTYKTAPTSHDEDPSDIGAPIAHDIRIDSSGVVISSAGLVLVGEATAGVLEERLSSTESRNLPVDVPLFSDIELTDPNGEVFTWIMEDTIRAVDGFTNRRANN